MIAIGERVDLQTEFGIFRSIIQDITANDEFLVSEPTRKGVPVYVPVGTVVALHYFQANCVYQFDAALLEFVTANELRMFKFSPVTDPVRKQRRNHYRLPISMPIWVAPQMELQQDVYMAGANKFDTSDLSQGGVSFYSRDEIAPDTILGMEMTLPPDTQIVVQGAVVRTMKAKSPDRPSLVCIQFLNSSNQVQRAISKFVVKEQQRRKRMETNKK